MEQATTIGLDIAKHVFQVHGADGAGHVLFRKRITRAKLLSFLAAQARCVVAMEACAGAHYWAREIAKLGHHVRLISPAYVKPFIKRQKNDAGFMHAVSVFLVAIAVVLLMAPAAYHRIVYAGEVSEDMHRVGSALVTAATVPLALGLAGDVCVVITKIAGSQLPVWWRQPGARFPKSGFSVRARTGSAARHADPPASRLSVLGRRKCRPGDRPPQGWLHC